MKKLNDIFNDENHLSKEDIKKYLKGNLNEQEKRAIEGKIESADFNTEAMEGFENIPTSIDSFEKIENKLNTRIHKSPFSLNGLLIFGSTLLLISAIGIILYATSIKSITPKTNSSSIENEKKMIIELTDSAIDVAETLPINKQISSSQIIVNSPIKAEKSDNLITEKIQKRTNEIIKMKMREAVKIDVKNNYKNPISIINSPHIYLHELLIFNYKERESIKKEEIIPELSGLPAAYETTKNDELEIQIQINEIPYNEFLKRALLDFRKNKFKSALKQFKVILKQYPNDINALFYGGLCYYNIKQQGKAIEHFEACITHSYSIFEEESNWYKAKSLYEKANYYLSEELLNKIIEKNGFYSKSAINLLDKIETKINN
jgi:TolA-binding protein